jgi:hypothetical protein
VGGVGHTFHGDKGTGELDIKGAAANLINGEIDLQANVNTATPGGTSADWNVDKIVLSTNANMTSGCIFDLGEAHVNNQTKIAVTVKNPLGANWANVGPHTPNMIETPSTTSDTLADLSFVNQTFDTELVGFTTVTNGSGKTYQMYAHM